MASFRSAQATPRRGHSQAGGHDRPLRVLQLSDPHLCADPEARLLGIRVQRGWQSVLALARSRAADAQALIVTGDLVHDESLAAYQGLRQSLEDTRIPYCCLAGNHDAREPMGAALGEQAILGATLYPLGGWNLLLLDSARPGSVAGGLGTAQLHWLEQTLERSPAPAVAFLHHHPTPVGSRWLDALGLEDGPDLLALAARHPQLKAILCGHIHQEFLEQRGDLRILGAPSTCVQFLPGSATFALDAAVYPGYRELLLYPDGSLDTWVTRLPSFDEQPDRASTGY